MEKGILTFLGKESGFGKKNNSAYIEIDNKLVLIDCGFTVFGEIKDKFDFEKYDDINIIITHLHNDHAGSLGQVILYMWFVLNKKVNIISKCKNIKEYLKITGTPREAYEVSDKFKNFKFIKTKHVKYLDAYGFIYEAKEKKIVYTGDTNTLEPFMKYIKNADELYVDISKFGGAHLKVDDVINILTKIKNDGVLITAMHLDEKKYIENKLKDII